MKRKTHSRRKRTTTKSVLRLPDLEHAKAAVLNSLTSLDAQRGYRHAIDEFVDWYCSEPRLALNRIVVLRYRSHLESRQLAPGTVNLRLGAVRRLAYEAADCGLLSADLAAGIRRTHYRPRTIRLYLKRRPRAAWQVRSLPLLSHRPELRGIVFHQREADTFFRFRKRPDPCSTGLCGRTSAPARRAAAPALLRSRCGFPGHPGRRSGGREYPWSPLGCHSGSLSVSLTVGNGLQMVLTSIRE